MLTNLRRLGVAGVCFGTATLFAQPADLANNARQATPSRHATAALEFDLNEEPVRGAPAELRLPMPGNGIALLQRGQFLRRGDRDGLWRGQANNRRDSEVLLTLKNGYLAGTIRQGAELYEIRPTANGHVIEKLDVATFAPCGGAKAAVAPKAGDPANPAAAGDASVTTATAAGDAVTVDLMTAYTPQARVAAGGTAQMEAVAQAAVDAANQAFLNSQVNANFRLVRAVEVAHNDAGDLNADLSWVASDATVAALRNQYGADMVSLIVENGAGYCGLGYVMRSVSSGFAGSAFQVTARSCAVGNLSFAHEHGHNLGMEHDPANGAAPTSASYPWSFGLYVNGVFRTVMSYASGCPNGCTRVAYFSNPNVTYAGYPTGVANTQDNARTANSTTIVAAGFRATAATAPPAAPTGLGATAVSSSQINLTWTDGSNNETGFQVERSNDGGVSFVVVAATAANIVSYSNTGLSSNSLYVYRVRAVNGVGNSGYTNIASVSTPTAQPPAVPASLLATAVSAAQVNLNWTDTATNETGFKVERSANGGAFAQIGTLAANTVAFADNGVSAAVTYAYRIRAFNADGDSAYSNTTTATTPAAAPAVPGTLSAVASYAGSGKNRALLAITLNWSNVANETMYRLERCKVSGKGASATCVFAALTTVGVNVVSYPDTGVATLGRGNYQYRVRAENSVGVSAWKAVAVNAN